MQALRVRLSRKKGWKLPPNTVSVAAYRRWVEENPEGQRVAAEAREALRGKNLACWCPLDGPCHAEVLLDIANR